MSFRAWRPVTSAPQRRPRRRPVGVGLSVAIALAAVAIGIPTITAEASTPVTSVVSVAVPAPDSTRSGLTQGGAPATFNAGLGNDVLVESVNTAAGVLSGHPSPIDVRVRRVDNASVTGERHTIWFANWANTGSTYNIQGSWFDTMQAALASQEVTDGMDNVFVNTGELTVNNIERLDFITAPITIVDPARTGFVVMERGGNDSFRFAPITGVDVNGDPTGYGPIVTYPTSGWGATGVSVKTLIMGRTGSGPWQVVNDLVPTQPIGGRFITAAELGFSAGDTFYGASMFPTDVTSAMDLVGLSNVPTNTLSASGGIDLIGSFLMWVPARLGDYVWDDTDRDGVQDPGEDPRAGVTVQLIDPATSTVIATRVTDSDGRYLFDDLDAKDYIVELVPPAGSYVTYSLDGGSTPLGTATIAAFQGDFLDADFGLFTPGPSIDVVKSTNTFDANTPTGPAIAVGDTVRWTYEVTNDGNVELTDIVVGDDQEGTVSCPETTLAVGDSMTCTLDGVATEGQYANNAMAAGSYDDDGSPETPNVDGPVDADPSHYFGVAPSVSIVKRVNGLDADTAPGAIVPAGSELTFTYTVTNTGSAPLTDIAVTDDIEGSVSCPETTLDPGHHMDCTATGTAPASGQYTNVGTVAGTGPITVGTDGSPIPGVVVTDDNPANAFVPPVPLTYAKTSDPAPGTAVKPGDTVSYTVTAVNATANPSTGGVVTDDLAAVLANATMAAPPTLVCSPAANACGELASTSGASSFVWTSTASNPLAGNTTATITYTVEVDAGATGTLHNVLVEPDIVVDHPIITWDKVVDKGANVRVDPGDTLTYTLTLANTGAVATLPFSAIDDLTNVVDNADFIPGSIIVSPTGRGVATYDAATKELAWTGALPAGQTVDISYQVTVAADAFGQLQNAFIDKTVVNPISASLRWRKVGPEGQQLGGAQWTLRPVDGAGQPAGPALAVVDCTQSPCTGDDTDPLAGRFLVVGLSPGNYRLLETKAPIGYVRNDTPIAVVVSSNAQITLLDDVVNDQQRSPALPFAGGIGSDHLKIAGAALLALTIALAAWQRRRRRLA